MEDNKNGWGGWAIGVAVFIFFGILFLFVVKDPPLGPFVTRDDSGNGLDLIVYGETNFPETTVTKYNKGADFPGTDDFLYATGHHYRVATFSATMVFKRDTTTQDVIISARDFLGADSISSTPASKDVHFNVFMTPTQIRYSHTFTTTACATLTNFIASSNQAADLNLHTIAIRRDILQDRVEIWFDGLLRINTTWAAGQDPGGCPGDNAVFRIGCSLAFVGPPNCGDDLDGQVYEVRLWDHWVPTAALVAITTQSDPDYTQSAEGTELGLWFLEDMERLTITRVPSNFNDAGIVFGKFLMALGIAFFFMQPLWRESK